MGGVLGLGSFSVFEVSKSQLASTVLLQLEGGLQQRLEAVLTGWRQLSVLRSVAATYLLLQGRTHLAKRWQRARRAREQLRFGNQFGRDSYCRFYIHKCAKWSGQRGASRVYVGREGQCQEC